MKKLNWGIISTGRISAQFVADLKNVTNAHTLAVAARNEQNAKDFANTHGIERSYGGYQALLNDPDIDVVYIGTPHTHHFKNARDAILAGKHVLCEKPITISSEQSKELFALAKSKGVLLMEALWTYFLPAIEKAKQWAEEGRIGEIKHIKADFGYPIAYDAQSREYSKDLAGGCLLDMGIYPIALARRFLDGDNDYKYINAHYAPNGVEDDVIIVAEQGEVKISLATSFQCKLSNYAYIIGSKGHIEIKDFWRASSCSLFELDEKVDHFEDNRTTIGLNYEAQAIGEDILAGKVESEIMPHHQSIWLQEQLEHLKKLL